MDADAHNLSYWATVKQEAMLVAQMYPGDEFLSRVVPGTSVLDLGCGTGVITRWLAGKGYRMIGVDINEAAIQEAMTQDALNSYVLADITDALPYPDNSFDAIVLTYVLVSMIKHEVASAVARECVRLIRPGGYVWLCEALYSPEYAKRYERGFSETGMRNVAVALDEVGDVKRFIKHYEPSEIDDLFHPLTRVYDENKTIRSSGSGMEVVSTVRMYQKV